MWIYILELEETLDIQHVQNNAKELSSQIMIDFDYHIF